ncbi:MAG: Methylated-DNA--protein-cysteine methyltransferase [Holosporales bacterium]
MNKYCFQTSLGEIILFHNNNVLYFLNFKDQPLWQEFEKKYHWEDASFLEDSFALDIKTTILSYFKNAHQTFDHIPLHITGTDFQKSVYAQLIKIPARAPITYTTLAKTLGKPTAQRAVGRAVGQNPILILIPCHRIIHDNSKTVGRYSGGLHRKDALLDLEKNMGQ